MSFEDVEWVENKVTGSREWRLTVRALGGVSGAVQAWLRCLLRGSWKGKTSPLGKNEAILNVSISVRGLMIQRLTDEWAEVFRPKKILK